jgi:hypothetical protein
MAGDRHGGILSLLIAMTSLVSSTVGHNDWKDAKKVMCYHSLSGNHSIYDYAINDVHNQKPIDWSLYRGNIVLVVNVASF